MFLAPLLFASGICSASLSCPHAPIIYFGMKVYVTLLIFVGLIVLSLDIRREVFSHSYWLY